MVQTLVSGFPAFDQPRRTGTESGAVADSAFVRYPFRYTKACCRWRSLPRPVDRFDRATWLTAIGTIRRGNTKPELHVWSTLLSLDYRFRLNGKDPSRTPKTVLRCHRMAITLRSGFWRRLTVSEVGLCKRRIAGGANGLRPKCCLRSGRPERSEGRWMESRGDLGMRSR